MVIETHKPPTKDGSRLVVTKEGKVAKLAEEGYPGCWNLVVATCKHKKATCKH